MNEEQPQWCVEGGFITSMVFNDDKQQSSGGIARSMPDHLEHACCVYLHRMRYSALITTMRVRVQAMAKTGPIAALQNTTCSYDSDVQCQSHTSCELP